MNKFDKRLSYCDERVVMRAPRRAAGVFEDRIYHGVRHDIGYSYGDEPPTEIGELSEWSLQTFGRDKALAYARLCASFESEFLTSYTKITIPNERAILRLCVDQWHEVAEHAWQEADGQDKLTWQATADASVSLATTLNLFISKFHIKE